MRIYLSYPMTHATPADINYRQLARTHLKNECPDVEVFDPEIGEPPGLTPEQIQEKDFRAMAGCRGLLVIWSQTAEKSSGVRAEIEWAARKFRIPIAIILPLDVPNGVPAWVKASAGGNVFLDIRQAVDYLKKQHMAEGRKDDYGKAPLALLPAGPLTDIGRVLDHGARKYGEWNWRSGIKQGRLASALLRHLFAYLDGEDTDKESGLPHLAHAGCCVLFMLEMFRKRPDMDDRYQHPDPPCAAGTSVLNLVPAQAAIQEHVDD